MSASKRRVLLWEPGDTPEGNALQFHLTYEGPLLSARPNTDKEIARVPYKHGIRRHFHKQLRKLWYTNPNLLQRSQHPPIPANFGQPQEKETQLEVLANSWVENGFRFVPLVYKDFGLNCKLEILMLRATLPGGLLQNSDIDNRLKTLFDTLQKPSNKQEIGDEKPHEGEDPFFVLLENDRLVTHVAVESDVLLSPVQIPEQANDVRLIITCTVWPYIVRIDNMDLI